MALSMISRSFSGQFTCTRPVQLGLNRCLCMKCFAVRRFGRATLRFLICMAIPRRNAATAGRMASRKNLSPFWNCRP